MVVWRKKVLSNDLASLVSVGKICLLGMGPKGIEKLNRKSPDPQTLACFTIARKKDKTSYTSIITCPRSSRSHLTSLTISVENIEDSTSSCITLNSHEVTYTTFFPTIHPYHFGEKPEWEWQTRNLRNYAYPLVLQAKIELSRKNA